MSTVTTIIQQSTRDIITIICYELSKKGGDKYIYTYIKEIER